MLLEKFLRNHWPSSHKYVASLIGKCSSNSTDPVTVLDIGCGAALYWADGPLSRLVDEGKVLVTLFDVVKPTSLELTRAGISRMTGLAPEDLAKFNDKSFDFVICLDVLEHLPKEDGYRVLYEMERISSGRVLIQVPNGFVWQPPSQNNQHNAHISSWTPKDMRDFGWNNQVGHLGFKLLFGPYGKPKGILSNLKLLDFGLRLIQYLFKRAPVFAFTFTATRPSRVQDNAQINVE